MLLSTMNKNKPRKVDRNSSSGYFDVKRGIIRGVLRERVAAEQSPERDKEMRGRWSGQTGEEGDGQKRQNMGLSTDIRLVAGQ